MYNIFGGLSFLFLAWTKWIGEKLFTIFLLFIGRLTIDFRY